MQCVRMVLSSAERLQTQRRTNFFLLSISTSVLPIYSCLFIFQLPIFSSVRQLLRLNSLRPPTE
jgi:hypothetical protein